MSSDTIQSVADPSLASPPTTGRSPAGKTTDALIDELSRTEGKAEIVNGKVVEFMATDGRPNYAAREVLLSLVERERTVGDGTAYTDNAAFVVGLPHRKSFSPDTSYHRDPPPPNLKFLRGAPVFAVEVRSENDYGPTAEQTMADKRADYFAAGTRVVWDVDVQDAPIVRKYTADAPDQPNVYQDDDRADAEPAVPGWSMRVGELVRS